MTSVAAETPAPRIASHAARFSVAAASTASSISASVTRSRFSAVVSIPKPTGLVRTSASPTLAPALRTTSSSFTKPVTESPYLGSSSWTEWPPQSFAPDSSIFDWPPARISRRMPTSSEPGNPTRFSAVNGSPPIAYTSEKAFVAAIWPNL